MRVGEGERVEFAVTRGDAAALLKDLRGRGRPQIEDIEIGALMKANLDGGDSFKVKPLNTPDQPVIGDRVTAWAWDVLPLEAGEHDLHLTVAVRVKIPGDGEEARDYPVKDKTVRVAVNPVYSIKTSLTSNLMSFRQYQQHGYNWLAFLRRFGLNGILADDMGLGKTLQALAVIRHSKETKARGWDHPSLIVCPVSVVANWEAEAKRFFPGTTVIQYRGSNRGWLRKTMYWADLVITSYAVAARDCEELADIPWNYIILDEAHAIKNPTIQRTQGVKRIGGSHKLALTGTPVQNAASDLWSVFDFLMPGYLGSLSEFRATYPNLFDRRTVSYGGHAEHLRKRVGPFVLRRLKKDVAQELPEKIVADRIVQLTDEQVRLYRQLLAGQEARRLRESIERDDYKKQGIHILALLTNLGQICNHPALERNGGEWTVAEAAKLSALEELLEEIIEGEHRALIFSQFTSMLDIIEHCLPDWHIRSLRIDGSTPVPLRQQFVNTFNEDASYQCMLLSTRAGGLGLNLTGADTVIFYDHDWNPTNDEQAQDRAYRIGQTRNVTVYRLITKGTLEEKILKIQERKKALAQALIGVDEQGFKNLTREELLSIRQANPVLTGGPAWVTRGGPPRPAA